MITGVFGLPGSGKSTFLCAIAQRAHEGKSLSFGGLFSHVRFGSGIKYQNVYSNFPLPNCLKLDFETLGKFNYHHCLILIDEISLFCDSRNFKSFSEDLKFFFAMHRHYKIDIVWCSQSYMDCDIKIRRITPNYYFLEDFMFDRSIIRPINQFLDVHNYSISEGYYESTFLRCALLNRKKYYTAFDSFEKKNLPDVPNVKW